MKILRNLFIGVLFIAVLLVFSSIVAAKEIKIFETEKRFMDKELVDEIKAKNVQKRLIADIISEEGIAKLKNKGCLIKHRLKGSTSFECPEDIIPEVKFREARIFHILGMESSQQINADDVWAGGITGKDVNVVILDTGVDSSHPELIDSYLGGYDFVENDNIPQDGNGHGTHVAGIITGDGRYTVNGRRAKGVAPDAGFYMLRVCNSGGICYEDDMEAAMEYAVNELNARVMSVSIGGGNFGSHCDSDPLAAKVNWVVDNGITAVIAAGNEGLGVSSPACASKAIAVGAVDKDNFVVYWSNRGSALDIVAPGVDVFSTYSCLAAGDCSKIWYAAMDGTSMSAPHVAGVAALMLDANPSLIDAEIKQGMYDTANPAAGCYECRFFWRGRCYGLSLVACNANIQGAGVIDAYKAYLSVKLKDDSDGDGVIDLEDNCPNEYNPGQEDIDNDGIGDSCDSCTDVDKDGYCADDCNDNNAGVNPGATEICDGADNDCDGLIDEELSAPLCEKQEGVCLGSVKVCDNGWLECDALNYGADYEEIEARCDDGLDNDCDGFVDLGDINCMNCADNDNDSYYAISTECLVGDDCDDNNYEVYPGALETECNGIENDCDDLVDEDYISISTNCGVGACYSTGQLNCEGGIEVDTCAPGDPTTEMCNNIDDDCDGSIDEGLGQTICGLGVCEHTVDNCVGGEEQVCDPYAGASQEICDSLDNDCDGLADEDDVCLVEKCWSADNLYIVRNGNQFKKFCKCAEGNYWYISASYVRGRMLAHKYIDNGNNENWETTSVYNYLPAYTVRCADGNWYNTNQDY